MGALPPLFYEALSLSSASRPVEALSQVGPKTVSSSTGNHHSAERTTSPVVALTS